jgi:hypothetical protein
MTKQDIDILKDMNSRNRALVQWQTPEERIRTLSVAEYLKAAVRITAGWLSFKPGDPS